MVNRPSPTVEATVDSVAYGGAGVARLDGQVVFVRGALPGEKARIRLTARHASYAQGELLEILRPSPDRVAPACPLAVRPRGLGPEPVPICAGCCYQHATPGLELALKSGQLADLLRQLARLDAPPVREAEDSAACLGYRNRITLHAGPAADGSPLGYVGEDNRTVLDTPACPLAAAPLNALLAELRARPGFRHALREGTAVTLRWTERDGALYWRGKPSAQESWLREQTALGVLSVPRASFFQVNPFAVDRLVAAATDLLAAAKPAFVVDAYCGCGLFSLAAAEAGVPAGAGIDVDPQAVAAAAYNAQQRGLKSFSFRAGPASSLIRDALRTTPAGRTAVLVDPPRDGLDDRMVRLLADALPPWIVYISCAPDTMARDAARLLASGYRVESVRLVNMFPRTAHFETVSLLAR